MLIERHKFSDNNSTVLDGNPHPVIDKLKHLAAFGRHDGQNQKLLDALK